VRLLGFLLLLEAAGCITHAFAPPVRGDPVESPAVLAPRETAIVGGGSAAYGSGDLGRYTVSVRMRRGLVRRLEGSLAVNAFRYESVQTTAATLGAGVKYCAILDPGRCALALTAGAGGGAYDRGALFGGDAGAILGWENPYLVPFIGARIGVGVPVAPRAVYDGNNCYFKGPPCGAVFNTPKANLILTSFAGLRFPLPFLERPRIALLAGYSTTWMFDGDRDQSVQAIAWAADVVF
jgi:hypothetical protein